MDKLRLDILLVEKSFFPTREKAKLAIVSGKISVNGIIIRKAGTFVSVNSDLKVVDDVLRYVSRGGLKLEKAIEAFNLNFNEKVVMDIGASTGGFTDCALQHGAKFCYCIDVGTNQLHEKIKTNSNVRYFENLHIKDLMLEMIDDNPVDIIVIDVSFISLSKVFPFLDNFLKPDGQIMALIKPQFEAESVLFTKNGIVKDTKKQKMAIANVMEYAKMFSFSMQKLTYSNPEKRKNIEFLALFDRQPAKSVDISKVVSDAAKYQSEL